MSNEARYVQTFNDWMTDWNPDAFVTINLPNKPNGLKRVRDHAFYLNCWTRAAEATLLGPRTLKIADFDRRIVWLFRREISPDDLTHYHAVVKFPLDRPWRDEQDSWSNVTRCERLQSALRIASSRTPEPFIRKNGYQPSAADVDVRPYAADRNH